MHNIVIYSDTRSNTSTYYLDTSLKKRLGTKIQITFVNQEQLSLPSSLNNDIDMFILPGVTGDDCHYYTHIKNAAEHIKQYISNGGVYLGMCAGAYYAMTDIEYRQRDNTFKYRKSPLGLIPGTAKGPVKGQNVPYDGNMEWENCVARKLDLEGHESITGKEGRALYSCGPQFLSDKGSLFKTFARYADHPEKPSALIMKNYGKGLVIASGSCPEYDGIAMQFGHSLEEMERSENKMLRLAADLHRHGEGQNRVWNFILKTAKQHRRNLAKRSTPMLVNGS